MHIYNRLPFWYTIGMTAERNHRMKRILWNITLSSIVTLVAYIALFAFWGAFFLEIEDQTLRLFMISLMTTVVYAWVLLCFVKKRDGSGEEEVYNDYHGTPYHSFANDFKTVIRREKKLLLTIAVIIAVCFALNAFDDLVMKQKTISNAAFIFIPLFILASAFKIPVVGYVLSAVFVCVLYLAFLLLYRRKIYNKWIKNK